MEFIHEVIKDIYYEKPKEKLRLRDAVRGIVLNEKNEVALLHIKCTDMFGNRNQYELPGGGIEEGEAEEVSMKREMYEEIGYEVEEVRPIGLIDIEYFPLKRIDRQHFYLAKTEKFVGTHLLPYEKEIFKEVVWVNINEIEEFYLKHKTDKVGKMIHERDLCAILTARTLINEKKA